LLYKGKIGGEDGKGEPFNPVRGSGVRTFPGAKPKSGAALGREKKKKGGRTQPRLKRAFRPHFVRAGIKKGGRCCGKERGEEGEGSDWAGAAAAGARKT